VAVSPSLAAARRDVLLSTKLHAPGARPGFVSRSRLTERLDEALGRGLVLVCAPAGYGKTALLAGWARHRERPVAWLSLDAGDNDPARFWRHARAARWTEERGLGAGDQPGYAREPEYLVLARVLLAQGRPGQALALPARLQRAFNAAHPTPGPGSGAPAAVPGIVEPLTCRELEVLGMLAAGQSNQAIARQLVVTLDTVKKHVSHVLGKLGAANRTEAVSRARRLDLIP
jgi:ATP/maltotriose-dependent transcriptional regulator MalT